MTYQKVVKSPQSVKMSSHTLLSDNCNSIPSSRSAVHCKLLLMSTFLSKMFDVGDLLVLTFGNCVTKAE